MVLVVLGVAVVLGSAVRALRRSTTEKTENTPALSAPAASDGAQPPMQTGNMVRIEGGKFRIGADGGDRDEQPLQDRTIRPFEIDVLEVTAGEFEGCVAAGKCSPATRAEGNCNAGKPERRHHPVNCVDQPQAAAYCAFVGKRLPTEAEWERAARGTAARTYPWGDTPPTAQLCWSGEGSKAGRGKQSSTCVVGTHPDGKTPDGVHDLAGNVWEWTASKYCPYDNEACSSELVVLRGGAFNNSAPGYVRGADRAKDRPLTRNDNLGFRCARDVAD
jgi:formylglycine-generating enzyme required for sulfatase activity